MSNDNPLAGVGLAGFLGLLLLATWPMPVPAASPPAAPLLLAGAPAPGAAAQRELEAALRSALSRPAPPGVAPSAVAALDFRRDPAVTAREQERAIAHLQRSGGHAEALEARIRSGAMLDEFDALLRRYGYSPTNLGDVLAAYLVLSWEVANGRDATAQPDGLRAVRRQLAGPLAGVDAVAGLDGAAKQAQAERSAYLALLATMLARELEGGNDRARLEALRDSVRRSVLGSGIDVRTLELGPEGLVAR